MQHEHKQVRDVMTSNPRTIEPSTTAAEAGKLLASEDVGILPIVEDGRLVGVLTDRDIVVRVVAQGKDPDATRAGDIASRELATVDPDQSLQEAARLMAGNQVRRLPVVEEDGRLVGMLAQADLALESSDELTGQVVEEISR